MICFSLYRVIEAMAAGTKQKDRNQKLGLEFGELLVLNIHSPAVVFLALKAGLSIGD